MPTRAVGWYLSWVQREVLGIGGEEKHVDEVDEDAGGHQGVSSTELDPLVEDEEDQVAKKSQEENHLWEELQDQPVPLLEVPGWEDTSHAQPVPPHPRMSSAPTEIQGYETPPASPSHAGESNLSPLGMPRARGHSLRTHTWLKTPNTTPKPMCTMPSTTDIFILKELRKLRWLVAKLQICHKQGG